MTGGGMDARHLERLVGIEGRRDGRQPAGEHRLSGAGRSREQQVMPTGGGDLQRASRAREPTHIGEIDGLVVEFGVGGVVGGEWRRLRPFGFALQARAQLRDRARRANLHAVHERRLGDVGRGHDHRVRPGGTERVDECEDAGHRAD
jgi:hypothetical protein